AAAVKRTEEHPPAQVTATTGMATAPAAPPASSPSPAQQPAPETLKLAQDINTPIRAQAAKPAAKQPAAPAPHNAASPARESSKPAAAVAPTEPKPAAPEAEPVKPAASLAQGAPKVEKRERASTPQERAEGAFRRGVVLLNQGRISEAEDELG